MPQLHNDGTANVVLTAEQKVLFKDFINSMIEDNQYANILVPRAIWGKADAALTRKFWLCSGDLISNYKDLSTIPLIPQLSDEIERFFLENPEALEGYLEKTEDNNELVNIENPYATLTPLPQYLQTWALTDRQRAKLFVEQPELYKHTKEIIDKEGFTIEAIVLKFVTAYTFVTCLIFCALAIAFPPVAAGWIIGAAAFMFLSMGSAYFSHKATKNAKATVLADLANSSEAASFNSVSLASQLNLAEKKDELVEVKLSVNASTETPVSVIIGPFFQKDQIASLQSNDSQLEEKSDLACR